MTRQKLPIGIQTFREIREENCYSLPNYNLYNTNKLMFGFIV
jgi:hypothetical protein